MLIFLTGCATLKESLTLGASTGALIGASVGAASAGNQSENSLKGGVLGGVIGGVISYAIHNSLEARDARVRKNTLLNLEKYDVFGREAASSSDGDKARGDKCYTTRDVDGRLVSIPCKYVNDPSETEER